MTKFLLLDWMDIQTDGHKNKEINNQSKTKMIREKSRWQKLKMLKYLEKKSVESDPMRWGIIEEWCPNRATTLLAQWNRNAMTQVQKLDSAITLRVYKTQQRVILEKRSQMDEWRDRQTGE